MPKGVERTRPAGSQTGRETGQEVDSGIRDAGAGDAALHRYVTESSASGLFVVQDGRVRWANPAALAIAGYSRNDLRRANPWSLVQPEYRAKAREVLGRPAAAGTADRCEIRIADSRGTDKWVEIAAAGIVYRNRPAMVVTAIDITDRKRLETQLHHSQKMEALGRLAGGVAHDFNNLLTVMAGYAQMALNRLEPLSSIRPDLEEILANTTRAAALTGQLLAFSRRQIIQPSKLDLNVLLGNTLKMLRRVIGEDIRLETRLEPEIGSIRVDAGQVEQVLLNLALNARDAMPKGGRLTIGTSKATLPRPDILPSTGLPPGDYVVLSVTDTGPGMDAETLARIFEPFFTTKEPGKGTGLGLPTVYGIARQSGGDVAVVSAPGKGSTFRVLFPSIAAPAEIPPAQAGPAPPPRGTERILLVEDDPNVRDLLKSALARQNYRVVEAADGAAALRRSRTGGKFDLLITDVVMPGMTGVELTARLSRRQPDLKVLFISGYSEAPVPLSQNRVLLHKPFKLDELVTIVRALLDGALQTRSAGS